MYVCVCVWAQVLVVYAADNNWFLKRAEVAPEDAGDEEAGTVSQPAPGNAGPEPGDEAERRSSAPSASPSSVEPKVSAARRSLQAAHVQGTILDLAPVVIAAERTNNYIQRRREAIKAGIGNKAKLVKKEEGEFTDAALRNARTDAQKREVPVFLFDTVCYTFVKGHQVCEVHVERLGRTDCDARIHLRTEDGNVAEGKAYGGVKEVLLFAAGKMKRSVGISLSLSLSLSLTLSLTHSLSLSLS